MADEDGAVPGSSEDGAVPGSSEDVPRTASAPLSPELAEAHRKWGHAKKAVAVVNFKERHLNHSTWGQAKKALRKDNRARAKFLSALETSQEYTPWPENAKMDFVLVYKPAKKTPGGVDAVKRDPRPMDEQDKLAKLNPLADGHKQADMRLRYINTLRINGLVVEIENFVSKFTEYRAIKIFGSTYAMDIWAEKFLMMKPVEPPFGAALEIDKSEEPADKLIAMYNETLYRLPKAKKEDDEEDGELFDASHYVPQTLKSVANSVKNVMSKIHRRYSSVDLKDLEVDGVEDVEEGEKAKSSSSDIDKYKESDAFKQLLFQNERYGSLWSTKIFDWVFELLHGKDPRLTLAKDTFIARAIRAPFTCEKKDKFLGSNEPEFYNSSERSLMVFRIMENPEEKSKEDEEIERKNLKLRDMHRAGCFEEGFPLHPGTYKLNREGAKWSDIDLAQIDNPRKLLRYFWSSSHMRWKYQPLNIVRNYFGSVTAMYFAYFGYYNFWLTIPAVVGTAVFIYGIFFSLTSQTVSEICDSGKNYLMCADCFIDGTCAATYLSDYCATTRITSAANNSAVVYFSVFMMVWMALFVTFWKRKQHTIAHQWGTTNSRSASAEVRVKYVMTKTNTFRFNSKTGKRESHVTFFDRLPQYVLAFSVVALFLSCTLLLTLTITIYKYTLSVSLQKSKDHSSLTRKYANEIANVITGSVSGTVIICLSYGYRIIANKLTDLENHRTQRDHDNQLSFKIYLFEFVNYYGTLLYIAFFKGSITSPTNPRNFLHTNGFKMEGCAPGGCMSEVSIQMILIMSLKQCVPIVKDIIRTLNLNKIQEQIKVQLLLPFIRIETVKRWREHAKMNLKDMDGTRAQYVQDFELREPTEMYQEYINNIIQLGFLTMFAAALPIAPLICVFINFWQLRQDATRYVKRVRRPIGFRSEGIGTWMNILEVLARIAILVNALLIAITFDFIPSEVYKRRYGSDNGMTGYVDFMLGNHTFIQPTSNTTETCRYWSYFHATTEEHEDFWKDLWIWRLFFIFVFQNIVSYGVTFITLICDSTPKSVRERMVLEEKIAQEWLSSESEESDAEDDVEEEKPKVVRRKKKANSPRTNNNEDTDV